jgi:hypothetical protein
MAAITATPDLVSILGGLKETTEIRDGKGELLGFFTPESVAEEERLKALFDLSEAERVLETERHAGRPLQEVLRKVRGQETSG